MLFPTVEHYVESATGKHLLLATVLLNTKEGFEILPFKDKQRQREYQNKYWRDRRATTRIQKTGTAATYRDFELYFWSRVMKLSDQCWPWTHKLNENGYGSLTIRGKYYLAHRIAFKLTRGYWPKNNVCHTCDNPPCCNPSHLFEGTQNDNIQDMITKGRGGNKGETNGRATIDDTSVVKIRLYVKQFGDSASTRKYLLTEYGLHRSTLGDIILGKTFKHLL